MIGGLADKMKVLRRQVRAFGELDEVKVAPDVVHERIPVFGR